MIILEGAHMDSTNLQNTKLIGVNLKNIFLYDVDLKGAWLAEDFQINYNEASDLFVPWFKANKENLPEKNIIIS